MNHNSWTCTDGDDMRMEDQIDQEERMLLELLQIVTSLVEGGLNQHSVKQEIIPCHAS